MLDNTTPPRDARRTTRGLKRQRADTEPLTEPLIQEIFTKFGEIKEMVLKEMVQQVKEIVQQVQEVEQRQHEKAQHQHEMAQQCCAISRDESGASCGSTSTR